MFQYFTKLIKLIETTCQAIIAGLSVFFCVSILIQIVARRCNISVSWTNELCTKSFVLAVFYGSVLVFKEAEHMSITVLTERVPQKFQKFSITLIDAAMLFMCCALAYSMFHLAGTSAGITFSTVTAIKLSHFYILCGISFVLSAIIVIWQMVCTFVYPSLRQGIDHQEDNDAI